jgi:two-component system nitrate/nitrite response regulator NarP
MEPGGRKDTAMSFAAQSTLRLERLRQGDLKRTIRVLIADDHGLIRETMTKFLENAGNFKVHSVKDFPSLINLCRQAQFDIILLDLVMPGMEGLGSIKSVVETARSSKVVIFSGSTSQSFLQSAMTLGVRGFIPKTMGILSVAHTLRLIDEGELFVPAQMAIKSVGLTEAEAHTSSVSILTDMERIVLEKIARGRRNSDIEWELQIRASKVRTLIRSACRKLNTRNRAHAVLAAQRLNLI